MRGTVYPFSYESNRPKLILSFSGRKIIQILEKNPKKDPSKYDDEDVEHMRRVVAYCKRHLAQEEKAKQDTNSKSYK
jgi:hypothetical protein